MHVTQVDGDLPADVALALRSVGRVAVDTETSGLDWSRDQLHLCQLYTPATGPVLLRHVDRRPTVLASVFEDSAVLKVLHFAPFDLTFLEAKWGVQSRSVVCTKTASRLLNPKLEDHSLGTLLQRHLGVVVDKGAVRTSNWAAPSLTDGQLNYAVGDVANLLDLHDFFGERLQAAGLAELYAQICAYMPVDAHLKVAGFPDPLTY